MFAFVDKKTRVYYHTRKFTEGVNVTGYFILPNDGADCSEVYTFTEVKDGIYYLDITYRIIGKYGLVIKEDGETKLFEIFKVGHL